MIVCHLPAIASSPVIRFLSVPAYGSFDDLRGEVANVSPAGYRVAVYIYVGGWRTKPTLAQPLTPIGSDGKWTCDITAGGNDHYATRIAAFLLPVGVNPPPASGSTTLPQIPQAVAFVQTERDPPPRLVSFAGYSWKVRRSDVLGVPGPNYFSDNTQDVWTDSAGLHLTIHKRNGTWYCTEVTLNTGFGNTSLGYGRYVFQLRGRVDAIDPNMVIDLFTWDNAPQQNHREMDITFSRWGAPSYHNAQYTVQPWTVIPPHRYQLNLTDQNNDLTCYLIWRPESVTFRTYRGRYLGKTPVASNLVAAWTYTGPYVPTPGKENIYITFWLYEGRPPTSGVGSEFIVTGFAWNSLATAAPSQIWQPYK
jgi:hypothetical protein